MVTANVPSGIVAPGTKVTLDCGTLGAIIYYTLDGTVPSASTGIRYTTPIEITENGTVLRAVAVKSGMTQSDVAGFTYRFAEDTQEGGDEGEGTQGAVIALKANAAQIKYLTSDGVSVRPDDTAARYEVIEMLSKLFDVSGVQPKDGFPDLDDAHRETVQLYAAAGIINGYPDGTFGGTLGITRAELVKILSVMLGVASEDIPEAQNVTLSDISGHWAEDYIKKFVAKGYILGYPEGDFRPDQFVTRAEVVTILNRITGITKVTGLPARFSDLTPEFWGYDEIMNVVE